MCGQCGGVSGAAGAGEVPQGRTSMHVGFVHFITSHQQCDAARLRSKRAVVSRCLHVILKWPLRVGQNQQCGTAAAAAAVAAAGW
jgi:hypothetical protein